ncbi:MAG TPA: xanthine dehydrogenase family protein molybdopterin-binding subunit [Bryobacteraceae bacterium]|nr:xanthine dehydrogenase family protein molybdopterin-binding subunit [Bryobacteraceae bacterium]
MSVMTSIFETAARFVPDKERDPLLDHDGFLGQSRSRVDAEVKVKGEARFTAEYQIPNVAHATLVYSTIARGKISKINTEKAKQAGGVLEVLTYKNISKMVAPPLVDITDLKKGMAASDLPILQDSAVRWDGQPIAVVVAETLEQAEYAASLVEVVYKADTPSVSFDGIKGHAVEPSDVIGEPAVVRIGNFEKGLQEAHARVDNVYRTPRYNHNAIEPHATLAMWKEDGSLLVLESTQSVRTTAGSLALIFRLRPENVQVIAPFVGGGFGGKGGLWNYTPLCAAAAKAVKRPVKLSLSREGVYRTVGGRTLAEQRIALGANRDGRLTALRHTALTATTDHGRYAEQCTFPARHLYASPNILIEQKIVNLDTLANTWMRAPGESIGTFALESALDELAVELRMDPIELRRVNEPVEDPTKGTKFSARHLNEAYRQGSEKFGWSTRPLEPRSQRRGKWLIGQGVATAYYPYYRFPVKARVCILADGKAIVQTPAAEMGMATATVQLQHAADRLGLPLESVSFHYGDSKLADTPVMAGGSNQTVSIFAAVQAAAEEVHRELLKLAHKHPESPLAGAKYEQLEARDGGLFRIGEKTSGETYSQILRRANRDSIDIEAESALPVEMMKYSMASYGAQFCEVRVHEETGELRVSRFLSSLDCGRVVNPQTATSQLRGGIVMGIGMALTEETLFDERRGRIMNPSLSEYHVPVNLDIPNIDVHFLNLPDDHAPWGARGIGEIGITGVAAAIANAVYHATGKRVRDLPITLDKLL